MFTYRNGYQWSVITSNSYNDNNWHHVGVVQDVEINGGYIFVDGVQAGSNSGGVVYLEGSIHSYLGADIRDYNKYLNGDINDVIKDRIKELVDASILLSKALNSN